MSNLIKFFKSMSFTQTLVFGYSVVILISALLLMLPISTNARLVTPIDECVFTTTSALSGTGLVLFDTYTYWSLFGQIVILVTIQIGGIGFMSMAIFALSFTNRKIGIKQRGTMRESVAAMSGGGIVKNTRFILKGTIITELLGAIALCFYFIPRCGIARGIYFSVFHSVSAFCTAGIDLMGYFEPNSSLITSNGSILMNVTIIILLTIGSIGFITWGDIITHKWHFKKYRLQSKLIILITVVFYIIGMAEMFIVEWNGALESIDGIKDKFLVSSMLMTSGRCAGFSPMDLTTLSPSTVLLMIFFMFIGASPGSTACGIKTTTFAVMILTIVSVFRKRKSVECFGRRIDDSTVKNACCVTTLYLMVVMVSAGIISAIESMSLTSVVFEVVSAISSIGLSMGITSSLSGISCAIITLVMFFGRIGGLSFIISLSNTTTVNKAALPEEKVMVG